MRKEDVYRYFSQFLEPHPSDIKEWVAGIDKLLCGNGCKIDAKIKESENSAVFTYTFRKNNKRVCRIHMGADGCSAAPYGHHFAYGSSILAELPEGMLDRMSYAHQCSGCATKRPDLVTHSFRYTHKGKPYNVCQHEGFKFSLDKAEERDLLEKWLGLELAAVRQN
jgi:hypothetical protein